MSKQTSLAEFPKKNYKWTILFWTIGLISISAISILLFNSTILAQAPAPGAPVPIPCVVDPNPTIPTTERIGMNMSFWTSYGAEQYQKNVIMNPGFEGQVDRIVVIVSQSDQTSFSDGQGLGQQDGHWNGASFEVRSGQSVGATGTIEKSLNQGANGLPQYFTTGAPPPVAVNDVIILTMDTTPTPVQQWWINTASLPAVTLDNSSVPPGSTGTYALMLAPTDQAPAEADSYLDSMNSVAGNLIVLTGDWQFSCWLRGEGTSPSLDVSFQRLNGTAPFFSQNFPATTDWQQVQYNFTPNDTSAPGTLKFAMINNSIGSQVYVDNISLGPVQSSNPLTPWRQDIIDMLKAIRPSYLRDWQGQLADTFRNRTIDVFGRQCWTMRLTGGAGSPSFGYSIPDFLELCTQVQATPWMIIPTTLTDSELTQFGQFLAQNADTSKFPEIVLEFGNENWNWLFRSGGIPVPAAHGPVADRAFDFITAASGPNVNINRVINGQFYSPGLTLQFAQAASHYDTMAVAPYFFLTMDSGGAQADYLTAMFTDNNDLFDQIYTGVQGLNKKMATYEENLHTMSGTEPAASREPYVAGAAAGAALAKRLIDGMFHNASPELVFCFAQFSSNAFDVSGTVKLWGTCRDCSPTKRLRPTGLAVKMLNQVINGSLHKINPTPPPGPGGTAGTLPPAANNLTLGAFRTDTAWGAVAVNANSSPQLIQLQFPDDSRSLPAYVNVLNSSTPMDTNEDAENVTISQQNFVPNQRNIQFTIPGYGLCVFTSDSMPQTSQSFSGLTNPTAVSNPATAPEASSATTQTPQPEAATTPATTPAEPPATPTASPSPTPAATEPASQPPTKPQKGKKKKNKSKQIGFSQSQPLRSIQ